MIERERTVLQPPAQAEVFANPATRQALDRSEGMPTPVEANGNLWLGLVEGFRRFSVIEEGLRRSSGAGMERASWAALMWGTEIFLRRAILVIARRISPPPSLARSSREFFAAFGAGLNPLMESYVNVLSQIQFGLQECMGSARPDAAYLILAKGANALNFPKATLWAISRLATENRLPEEACGLLLRIVLIMEGQATLDPAWVHSRDLSRGALYTRILDALSGHWTELAGEFNPIMNSASFGKAWDEFLRTYRL